MAGPIASAMSYFDQPPTDASAPTREYDVLKQRVELDIDFPKKSVRGSTEITIQPHVKTLTTIRLHARQCRPTEIQAGGIAAKWEYTDPYRKLNIARKTSVHQHGMLKDRIRHNLRPKPEPQLIIELPKKLKIQELKIDAANGLPLYSGTPSVQKQEADAMAVAETPIAQNLLHAPQFAPIKLTIEFELDNIRDGLHWVGCEDSMQPKYPHMYTKLEPWAGNTSCIFPCVDDATSRCVWEIGIRCPRTLGDAFRKPRADTPLQNGQTDIAPDADVEMANDTDEPLQAKGVKKSKQEDEYLIDLQAPDDALELAVLCVGEATDDIADPEDDTKHTVVFTLNDAVTARHIGFAIGPFEHVDLTNFRASEEESKLGQTAVKVDGYCLPGRVAELENTCYPICQAVDHISVNCGRFPFPSYQVLFVDDMIYDTVGAAGLSFCSNRLLFPQEIIEPLDRHTRILIRAVADQWSGVSIVPSKPTDAWAVAGIAGYLTDVYMKKLAGNNQYRWEQKLAAEKVYELDVDRPSIQEMGRLLHYDSSIRDFVNLKSAVVLGILDRRLLKLGATGVLRIINKIFLNAKTGTLVNGELSTADFQRTCERLGHNKLDPFFRQWVAGAGCPIFHVTQRFNKKKLVVEMTITQRQLERQTKPPFEPSNFMREVKEHVDEVWAPEALPVFTGPMTIRIHEADGTPYEHIVEIKEHLTKLEIPYNTKYKRLKRSRRQKERTVAEGAGDGEEASLLYCLGDILDSSQERQDWKLADWSAEDEAVMSQENYEWIRIDADFEWIGKIHLVMPLYMYISQLQQDRDLVAQYESMRYLLGSNPHHVSLTILIRTLMDTRYFYGIRVMAAEGLATLAKDKLMDIGKHHLMKAFTEFYCETVGSGGHIMPRPNDFSSRVTFIMQCAIPQAMAMLRDDEGKVPKDVREFFRSLLIHNDNSDNSVSDCHYVATLMTCLTDALVASHREVVVAPSYNFAFGEDEDEDVPMEPENPDAPFEKDAVNEIERYRRLDEWVVTYQNVYSTTAIQCLQKLTKAGIVKDKATELIQYTRSSTANIVRLEAFRCLNEMGLARRPAFMKHLLHSLSDDDSPYFRERLLRYFGEALGHLAFGDDEPERPAPPPLNDGGLVLEEAASDETRRIEATRKTTPDGAIAALKRTVQDDEAFKQALWYAATSSRFTLDEVASICDIAALIFEAITSNVLSLRLPRPYKVEHQGKGRMRFYQYGSTYRAKPTKGLEWEDYENLETLGLQYTGPLAGETKSQLTNRQREAERKAEEARRASEDAIRQSYAATTAWQSQAAASNMPPPPLPSSAASTPVEQKSGFKLSLGGPKRKASVDLAAQREDSPKTIKINKASTPGTAPKNLAAGNNTQRQSSVSAGKSAKVVFTLSIAGYRKARDILSRPPVPGRAATSLPPTQKIVLKKSAKSAVSPMGPPQSIEQHTSPVPVSSLTAGPALKLNLGGFRSFGGGGSAASPPPAAGSGFRSLSGPPDSISPPPAITSLTSGTPPGHPHGHPAPLSLSGGVRSLSSMSPVQDEKATAPPPPKKKFTLKLGGPKAPTPSGDGGAGSPK